MMWLTCKALKLSKYLKIDAYEVQYCIIMENSAKYSAQKVLQSHRYLFRSLKIFQNIRQKKTKQKKHT